MLMTAVRAFHSRRIAAAFVMAVRTGRSRHSFGIAAVPVGMDASLHFGIAFVTAHMGAVTSCRSLHIAAANMGRMVGAKAFLLPGIGCNGAAAQQDRPAQHQA